MTIEGHRAQRATFAALAVIAAAALAGLATLTPREVTPGQDELTLCVLCGERSLADLLANIALFLPLGFALRRFGVAAWAVLLVALGASIAIELAQLLIPGRTSSVSDLIGNALGGLVGALLAAPRSRDVGAPRRRVVAAALLAGGAVAFCGWLLRPADSAVARFSHWSPRFGHLAAWTGTVTRAAIDGRDLPHGEIEGDAHLRSLLDHDGGIELAGIAGAAPARLAPIFMLTDTEYRELLLIGADGPDLVVRWRRRSNEFLLEAPTGRFAGLLGPVGAGSALTIQVEIDGATACATVNGRRDCLPAPSAGAGWSLLQSSAGVSRGTQRGLDGTTVFVLLLPLGLALARGGSRGLSLGVGLTLAACAAATAAAGIATIGLVEGAGALLALAGPRWIAIRSG